MGKKKESEFKKKGKKLSFKQLLFIEEYLIDFNCTRAAKAAGYSEKMAYSIGWENARKPEIREEIIKRTNELLESKREIIATVVNETIRAATADIKEFTDEEGNITKFSDVDTRPISSYECIEKIESSGAGKPKKTITKKIKLLDKNKALENLARYIDLSKESDSLEIGGKIELVIPKDFIPSCNTNSTDDTIKT